MESHLVELRYRLIICCVVVVCLGFFSFFLCPSFVVHCQKLAPEFVKFVALRPGEIFFAYIKVSLVIALFFSSPFLLYQVFAFVCPALSSKERLILSGVLVTGYLFGVGGMIFAYLFVLQPVVHFLLGFGMELGFVSGYYSLSYYLDLIVALLLGVGLAFEVPVCICLLGVCGIVDYRLLLKHWRYAIVGGFGLAAVLTPTVDPLNMMVLGCGLNILYLGSVVFLYWWAYFKKKHS